MYLTDRSHTQTYWAVLDTYIVVLELVQLQLPSDMLQPLVNHSLIDYVDWSHSTHTADQCRSGDMNSSFNTVT